MRIGITSDKLDLLRGSVGVSVGVGVTRADTRTSGEAESGTGLAKMSRLLS